jgi:hypothetical protein
LFRDHFIHNVPEKQVTKIVVFAQKIYNMMKKKSLLVGPGPLP